MNTEKSRYFQELTLNLQYDGFTVKPETEAGLLTVELDGQRLCLALENSCPMTDERQQYLESAAKQIEQGIPDLEARVKMANQKGMEFACM